MKNLHMYFPVDFDELAKPEAKSNFSLDTPALDFLQDFKKIRPIVVDTFIGADELSALMLNTHEALVSVEDQHGHFIGIVTLDNLCDQNLMRKQAEGFKRSEIRVTDLMIERKDLHALAWDEIRDASIGDVIKVLKKMGRRECLVVDQNVHRIRGILSASEISRLLQRPIDIHDKSSFYRVFAPVSIRN